jgi:hypothetical protein
MLINDERVALRGPSLMFRVTHCKKRYLVMPYLQTLSTRRFCEKTEGRLQRPSKQSGTEFISLHADLLPMAGKEMKNE